ncbi:MAG: hypothetical protein AB1450_15160 [Pseudomonadota bacterium]
MIVTSSALQLHSSHSYLEYRRRHESLTVWRDDPNGRQQLTMQSTSEQLRLGASSASLALGQGLPRQPPAPPSPPPLTTATVSPAAETGEADATVHSAGELQVTILKLLVERLTGRKLELFDASEINKEKAVETPPQSASSDITRTGGGAIYHAEEIRVERESTQFSAHGSVRTADGREIQLAIELNMSREFISHTSLDIRAGAALKDPLVINFAGNAAELTAHTFAFDIDVDGQADEIAFVGPDSGFLALDRNGDGHINDGSELFGALSGDGFADLAQYDDDGNGWIDGGDAIFARLLVWSRDGGDSDQLVGLLERNVGAIYLGRTATPFALKDDANALQGAVRASGIYLQEDGGAGTVQQLDLVV